MPVVLKFTNDLNNSRFESFKMSAESEAFLGGVEGLLEFRAYRCHHFDEISGKTAGALLFLHLHLVVIGCLVRYTRAREADMVARYDVTVLA